jgi:hypothetical protein
LIGSGAGRKRHFRRRTTITNNQQPTTTGGDDDNNNNLNPKTSTNASWTGRLGREEARWRG